MSRVVTQDEALDWIIVEVSSFQLEKVDTFHPRIGVLLNLQPDHLDRHGDLAVYLQAKQRIFAEQQHGDFSIIGGDDLVCRDIARQLESQQVKLFGHKNDFHAHINESIISVKWKGSSVPIGA